MKILVFTEGTILMHSSGIIPKGKWNKELKDDINDYGSYKPVKNAVEKIEKWKEQDAEIFYLTSRRKQNEINQIKNVLSKFNFPDGELFFCKKGEEYIDVAKKIKPDVWIDDDCKCIGGRDEDEDIEIRNMGIKLILTHEFSGIDYLPDDIEKLLDV